MIRVRLVAPYRGIVTIARQAIRNDPREGVQLDIVEATGVHILERLNFDVDAVISRGVSATALRHILPPHIPLVELKVTSYDVLRAVDRCRRRYDGAKISVIGSRNMVEGVQSVADILGISLDYGLIAGEEDAKLQLEESIRNGAQVVIAGAFVSNMAKRRGINVCLIESGREAVLTALDEAVHVASTALKERVVAERIRTVMDVIGEGIVAVDEHGNIDTWNAAASRMFGDAKPGLEVGRSARDVLPQFSIDTAVRHGRQISGAIHNIGPTNIIANIFPLAVDDRILGGVATFQEVERIQEFERKIRANMRVKGHQARYAFKDLVGDSAQLRQVVAQARKFAKADVNVLIFGETGTGKEIFAQSLHNESRRRKGPFVAVNCAALAESLLESELFGYVGGAFTGASKSGKPGLFELAHNGSIFLDEISEIPHRLQSKLLRVLQEQEIMRIGDDRIVPIDVRVFAASNRNLKRLAEKGQFRQDLLYRLDVLEINIPPLRERRQDVRFLARQFLDEFGRRAIGKPMTISEAALALLMAHDWPGNVRELRNVCERLSVLATASAVTEEEIAQALGVPEQGTDGHSADPAPASSGATIAELNARAVKDALAASNGNKSQAARMLGISRSTLWRFLQRAG